jgi:hypothetical protein
MFGNVPAHGMQFLSQKAFELVTVEPSEPVKNAGLIQVLLEPGLGVNNPSFETTLRPDQNVDPLDVRRTEQQFLDQRLPKKPRRTR